MKEINTTEYRAALALLREALAGGYMRPATERCVSSALKILESIEVASEITPADE